MNRTLSRFCKCGDLHNLSRRFHNLDANAKAYALEAIQNGTDPATAIRDARRAR